MLLPFLIVNKDFQRPAGKWDHLTGLRSTKAFETVPHRRLRATPPMPRAIGPCRCRTTGQRLGELAKSNRRPLCTPACVARGDFLEVGNFATFCEFLHIKGRNFPDFFPFTSTYDRYER